MSKYMNTILAGFGLIILAEISAASGILAAVVQAGYMVLQMVAYWFVMTYVILLYVLEK